MHRVLLLVKIDIIQSLLILNWIQSTNYLDDNACFEVLFHPNSPIASFRVEQEEQRPSLVLVCGNPRMAGNETAGVHSIWNWQVLRELSE